MTDERKNPDEGRPVHSIEPNKHGRPREGEGARGIDAPHERVDDEVGSDESKKTKRTE